MLKGSSSKANSQSITSFTPPFQKTLNKVEIKNNLRISNICKYLYKCLHRLFCLKTIDTLNRVGITTLDCFSLLIICYATADATKMPTTHYDNNAFAVVVS